MQHLIKIECSPNKIIHQQWSPHVVPCTSGPCTTRRSCCLIMHTHQICHLFRHVRFFWSIAPSSLFGWMELQEACRVVKYSNLFDLRKNIELRKHRFEMKIMHHMSNHSTTPMHSLAKLYQNTMFMFMFMCSIELAPYLAWI
jgi:hypothetical protein